MQTRYVMPASLQPTPLDELRQLVAGAPPMTGGEYLSIETLAGAWQQILEAIRTEIAAPAGKPSPGSRPTPAPVQVVLRRFDPASSRQPLVLGCVPGQLFAEGEEIVEVHRCDLVDSIPVDDRVAACDQVPQSRSGRESQRELSIEHRPVGESV